MKNKTALSFMLFGSCFVAGCSPQSTPSMMNTSRPQVVSQTSMQQIPVEQINNGFIQSLADNYSRYGSDTLHLSLAYDPSEKNYGAMKAFNDLANIKSKLSSMGVRSVTAETLQTAGTKPTLMVSYDSMSAQRPEGCQNMPGFEDGLTTREIGNYKFGCSIDTMVANQIYRPGDLMGQDGADLGDGRHAANTVEYYRQVDPKEAEGDLKRIDRADIKSQ